MPYSIREDGTDAKPWCVYLDEDDEKLGCTTSESEAEDMIAAIEANKGLETGGVVEKAVEVSYEELMQRANNAFWRTEYGVNEWIVATYPKYVVARDDSNGLMYRHDYKVTDDGYEFEEGVEVEHSWVEKHMGLLKTVLDVMSKVWAKVRGQPEPEPAQGDGIRSSVFMTKETDEGHRWVFVSSTALLDLENEIVARKAIEASLARAEEAKAYGPLIFWHFPEIRFGECDFQARDKLCLVESGLWNTSELAEAARKTLEADPEAWKPSIGFVPVKPPLENVLVNGRVVAKVWEDIQIVERSIVSAEWAANQFATVHTKEVREMDPLAEEALRSLVGDDLAAKVLEDIDGVNAKATAAGAIFKAVDDALDSAGKTVEGSGSETPSGLDGGLETPTPAPEVKGAGESQEGQQSIVEGEEQKAVPAEALTLLQRAAEQLDGEQKARIASVIAELEPPEPVVKEISLGAEAGEQIVAVLAGLTDRLASLEVSVEAVRTKQAADLPRLSLFRASQGTSAGAESTETGAKTAAAQRAVPKAVRSITKAAFKLA